MPERATRPELLLHADFVRTLARALVGADADDLAQQTWVRAMQSAPPRRNARAFLGQIVRRLAANRRRGERRRLTHEKAAPRVAAGPTPEQVAEREEARQRVVNAVLSLEEPFREVILLRFYEDLPPRAIAHRLGVPGATVRTRLCRALEKLRARLDAEEDRRAWAGPLLGWLGNAVPIGVITMKKVLAAAVALLLLCGAWFVLEPEAQPGLPSATPVAAAVLLASPAETAPDPAARSQAAPVPVAAPLGIEVYAAVRGVGGVHGLVVDENGSPIAGAAVRVRPVFGALTDGRQLADDRRFDLTVNSDASGAFAFAKVVEGPSEVVATTADGCRCERLVRVSSERDETLLLCLGEASAPYVLVVEVLDRDRRPQSGVRVEGYVGDRERSDGTAPAELVATTDDCGLARFVGVEPSRRVFRASDDRGRAGMSVGDNNSRWRVITLAATGSLRGRLLAPVGVAIPAGTLVQLHAGAWSQPYWSLPGFTTTVAVQDHEFTADLPAGSYGVTLEGPTPLRLELQPQLSHHPALDQPVPNSVAMTTVDVVAARTTAIDLPVAVGGRIAGLVTDNDGRPVAGATVEAFFDPKPREGMYVDFTWPTMGGARALYPAASHGVRPNPLIHLNTRTSSDGRYQLQGLQRGLHRVEVTAPRMTWDMHHDVAVADDQTAELQHLLKGAGALQVIRDSYVRLASAHDPGRPLVVASLRGVGTFAGLEPGAWTVLDSLAAPGRPEVVLAEVTVVAGQLTSIDLRECGERTVIAGRILAGGAPVARASVRWYLEPPVFTDSCGAFSVPTRRCSGGGIHPVTGPFLEVQADGVSFSLLPPPELGLGAPRIERDWQLGDQRLELRATSADGLPLSAGVDLRCRDLDGAVGAPVAVSAKVPVPPGGLQLSHLTAGKYSGQVRFPSGVTASVTFHLPASEPLVLREARHGALEIAVTSNDGSTVANRTVWVREWLGDGAVPESDAAFLAKASWRQGVTDGHGMVRMSGLRCPEVLVQLYDQEPDSRSKPRASRRVPIEAGLRQSLSLPAQ